MWVETWISLDSENLLHYIISSFSMLDPNIITFRLHLFAFKLLFIFLVVFFFALLQISHFQFLIFSSSTSSHYLIIELNLHHLNTTKVTLDLTLELLF